MVSGIGELREARIGEAHLLDAQEFLRIVRQTLFADQRFHVDDRF